MTVAFEMLLLVVVSLLYLSPSCSVNQCHISLIKRLHKNHIALCHSSCLIAAAAADGKEDLI